MHVKDIVKPAVVISETDTFANALTAMTTGQTNTLLVTNEQGELAGEVTVADLLDAIVPETLNGTEVMEHFTDDSEFITAVEAAKGKPVSEFMSQDFSALTATDDLMSIIATAITFQRARIPVVDADNKPVGIISRRGLKQILYSFLQQ